MDRYCGVLGTHLYVILIAGVLAFFTKPARAFEVDIGPEEIILRGRYEKPAFFPHRKHQGVATCTVCHHTRDRIMTIDKCEPCHNNRATMNADLDSIRKVSHILCRDCHRKEVQKGRTSAPTACRGCHNEKAGNPP